MKLEQVVHRIATQATFASAVRKDLSGTLAREGIALQPEELAALQAALSGSPAHGGLLSSVLDPVVWWSPQFDPKTS